MQRPSKGLEGEGSEDRDVSFSVKSALRCAAIGQHHPELTSHCFGAGKKPSNERVEAEQHDRRSCSIWRRQATSRTQCSIYFKAPRCGGDERENSAAR